MNRPPNSRAIVDPLTLCLVGALALGIAIIGTTWKPLEVFRRKPPTQELTKLQLELTRTQAEAAQALKARDAAQAAERAKFEQEIRQVQADALGTTAALAKVPAVHRTAEVKLASNMAQRVSLKLAAAIGALPLEQQSAMISLIDQALSDKQSEVDEATRKLAAADAAFATLAAERDQIQAQIPTLIAQAAKAEETAQATQSLVSEKTNQVKMIADQLDAKSREAGSLGAAADSAMRWVVGVVAGWLFLAYVLPGLVKHLDGENPLKGFLRNVSGYATAPLLYHDAKSKLDKSTAQ